MGIVLGMRDAGRRHAGQIGYGQAVSTGIMIAAHVRPEAIGAELDKVRREFSTSSQVLMALVGQTVAGTIGSLILGLFIGRKSANRAKNS
ncbi:MAG: hypothetical protein Q8937_05395 [Bacteroidota bacterium]|nr:hypothetical protein [Bacteroidota bacterium]